MHPPGSHGVFLLAGIRYDAAVAQDSPIAYWKLDEAEVGDGTDLLDTEGGRHATARGNWRHGGGPTVQVAGGLEWAGGTRSWVDAGTARILGTGTGFAFEGWFKVRRPAYIQIALSGPNQAIQRPLMGTLASPTAQLLTMDSNGALRGQHSAAGVQAPDLYINEPIWRHIVFSSGASGTFLIMDGQIVAGDEAQVYSGTLDDIGMVHTLADHDDAIFGARPYDEYQVVRAVSRVAIYDHELIYARALAHWNARFGTEDDESPILNSAFDNLVVSLGASHYWRLDEDDTSNNAVAADSIGSYHGTYKGALVPAGGPTTAIIKAVEFPGASGSYVDLGAAEFFNGSANRTFGGWFYGASGSEEYIAFNINDGQSNDRWLRLSQNTPPTWYVFQRNSNLFTSGQVTAAAWHFIVAVWAGDAPVIYVDGSLASAQGGAAAALSADVGRSKRLSGGTSAGLYFRGKMARFFIASRAFTASEVGQMWDARLAPADAIDNRDAAATLGRVWIADSGQPDTIADILYRIELAVKGYYGDNP